MLIEQRKPNAVKLSARYLIDPVLSRAVNESVRGYAKKPYFKREFALIDRVISGVNELLDTPRYQRDSDLVNIYDTQHTLRGLPILFSWKDTQERRSWTKALKDTFATLNEEIPEYYTDPEKINSGNPQDVFRFYLFDGYARWRSILNTNRGEKMRTTKEEQSEANAIVNALCEYAVVGAEAQDPDMKELVVWFVERDWYKMEYGFSGELVARARAIKL